MSLDFSHKEFRNLLHVAADEIADLYESLDQRKVFPDKTPEEIAEPYHQSLPDEGGDAESIIREAMKTISDRSTWNISSRFFAYVTSCGHQAGILGDMLAAAINQNCGKWHIAPAAAEIEKTVVSWLAEFTGLTSNYGGIITTGGSHANFTCLHAARDIALDRAGLTLKEGLHNLVIYGSTETHSCVDKSLSALGMGKDQFVKIQANSDCKIDLEKLEKKIVADKKQGLHPFCVVGNAGTVNTGAVDNLDALADLCEKHDLWFHVDGAYGAPAAATHLAPLFKGMDRCDSIAIDPHKWLYAPVEAGCALLKEPKLLRQVNSLLPPYLSADVEAGRMDYMEYGFQLSRGFKAFKLWLAFRIYGAQGFRDAISTNIHLMDEFKKQLATDDEFEVVGDSGLSVVCFRYRGKNSTEDLDPLNRRLLERAEAMGEVFIGGTVLNNQFAFRICCVNHRVTQKDVDALLEHLREGGRELSLKKSA